MGRVLFFDIDGTLVGFDKKMPDSARKAVLRAKDNGHILILCTGRGECQLYPLLQEIGIIDQCPAFRDFDAITGINNVTARENAVVSA